MTDRRRTRPWPWRDAPSGSAVAVFSAIALITLIVLVVGFVVPSSR